MATERLSMRQTREILRQKWSLGRTHREVAQSLGISSGAAKEILCHLRDVEEIYTVPERAGRRPLASTWGPSRLRQRTLEQLRDEVAATLA